jgi:hypothetical protein
VVARYRAAGAEVFSTGEDGAIVVDTDGYRVGVWTFTGRERALGPWRAETRHGGGTKTTKTTKIPKE